MDRKPCQRCGKRPWWGMTEHRELLCFECIEKELLSDIEREPQQIDNPTTNVK